MKKIIYIILLLAAIGGGIYYYLSSTASDTPEDVKVERSLRAVSDNSAISPINSYDNSAVWYGLSDGKMIRYDLNSQALTEYPLPVVPGNSFKAIYWPTTGADFIAQGVIDNQPIFNYFNSAEKKYYQLPPNVKSLDWLSDSKRIVVIWKSNDGKTQLVTSNADGTGYQVIRELPWDDLIPKASPNDNSALLYRSSMSGEINKIYLFNLVSGEYTETVSTGKNNGLLWSPTGTSFVYTRLVDKSTVVMFHNLAQLTDEPLALSVRIDKIAFSQDGKHLFAAARNGNNIEEIVKIDLENKKQEVYFTLPASVSAKDLIVIGQKLFFINGVDGKLYSVE